MQIKRRKWILIGLTTSFVLLFGITILLLFYDNNSNTIQKQQVVIYNKPGATCGSFFIDMLELNGFAFVDELWNPRRVLLGLYYTSAFKNKNPVCHELPNSIENAFKFIETLEPLNPNIIGLKICGNQHERVSDFEKVINDKNILKIFLYRKNEIDLYLTMLNNLRLRKGKTVGFDSMRYNPEPFKYYDKLKANGAKNYIEVESEDIFDLGENTVSKMCQSLGIDEFKLKSSALAKLDKANVHKKRLDEMLTEHNLNEMVKFFKGKYSKDQLRSYECIDCTKVHKMVGFLKADTKYF